MIALIASGVWLAGVLLALRPMMRRRMLRLVCAYCGEDWTCSCRSIRRRVVRGAHFDRDGYDVIVTLWDAALWPLWLPAWLVGVTVWAAFRLLATGVIRSTPLTGPELERRIAEQNAEITRLTKEINKQ